MLSRLISSRSLRCLWIPLTLGTAACASVLDVQKGGFNLISLDQEWAMREDMKRQVTAQYKLVNDPQAVAFVTEIGRRLVAQTELRDRTWDFGIVEDDAVNAFNLPGGLVYVHKGLLKEADSLDELTAVMGHEIGHGVARHGTQLMTRSAGIDVLASIALGQDPNQAQQVLAGLVSGGVLMRYSREAESEADRLGIGYSNAAGYDPNGAVTMFQRLLALRKSSPSRLEQFMSSHPLAEDRIAAAQAFIRTLPRPGTVRDTQAYQLFRRQLGVG